jgi:hypothetical protein
VVKFVGAWASCTDECADNKLYQVRCPSFWCSSFVCRRYCATENVLLIANRELGMHGCSSQSLSQWCGLICPSACAAISGPCRACTAISSRPPVPESYAFYSGPVAKCAGVHLLAGFFAAAVLAQRLV